MDSNWEWKFDFTKWDEVDWIHAKYLETLAVGDIMALYTKIIVSAPLKVDLTDRYWWLVLQPHNLQHLMAIVHAEMFSWALSLQGGER